MCIWNKCILLRLCWNSRSLQTGPWFSATEPCLRPPHIAESPEYTNHSYQTQTQSLTEVRSLGSWSAFFFFLSTVVHWTESYHTSPVASLWSIITGVLPQYRASWRWVRTKGTTAQYIDGGIITSHWVVEVFYSSMATRTGARSSRAPQESTAFLTRLHLRHLWIILCNTLASMRMRNRFYICPTYTQPPCLQET